ncbi:MAG: hypothetical protein JXB62_06860 [Pirellulales bacterium]|nr:hypothetical protein [Pirellulales bacterium]
MRSFGLAVAVVLALATTTVAAPMTFRDIDRPLAQVTGSYSGTLSLVTAGAEGDSFTIVEPYWIGVILGLLPPDAVGTYEDIGGFDPALHQAFSGRVNMWLLDDFDATADKVQIQLESIDQGVFVPGYESFSLALSGSNADLLLAINETGEIDYLLQTTPESDLILDYIALEVDAGPKMTPEPSSVVVWGMIGSVLGAGWWFRRKRR